MTSRGGDDLEDDYAPDGLVAASDIDDDDAASSSSSSPTSRRKTNSKQKQRQFVSLGPEEEDEYEAFSSDLDNPGSTKRVKRKRDGEDEAIGGGSAAGEMDAEVLKREKKRRRRAKDNENKAKKQRLTITEQTSVQDPKSASAGMGTTVSTRMTAGEITAAQSPVALAMLLRKGQVQVMKNVSSIELDDFAIPDTCIMDTTAWTSPRTFETLPDFINTSIPTLSKRIAMASKENGAPTCIMLAGNALRVTDLTRSFRTLKGEKSGEICKLFARHFKVAEHAAHLRKTKVCVAIGTPSRVGALLTDDASLSINALSHVILDVSYMDSKQRSMLDQLDLKNDLFTKFLAHKPLLDRFRNGKTSIVFF